MNWLKAAPAPQAPTGCPIVAQSLGLKGGIPRLALLALLLLALAGCHSPEFPQVPANYREYAYVTNGASGTLTVVDVINVRLDRELTVGVNPVALAVSPTRNEVYVVNSGAPGANGSLSVVDAEHNTLAATIQLHRQPVSIDIDATGDTAYVANAGSNSVSVVDLKARREIAVLGAGEEPVAARIAADGKTLIVANRQGNSVTLIDPSTRTVRQVFEGCPGAADTVILPDSTKAFVACSAGHQVMVLALARPDAQPARTSRIEALLDVGQTPVQLALKPDGGEIFTMNTRSNSVSELYNSTDEVGSTYMMGAEPARGIVSPDNALLYVANAGSQEVAVYTIDEGKRAGSIHVGDGPVAMAFSTAGHLLFVVDSRSGDIAAIRTASRSLLTFLPAGRAPNAIAIKSFTVQ